MIMEDSKKQDYRSSLGPDQRQSFDTREDEFGMSLSNFRNASVRENRRVC